MAASRRACAAAASGACPGRPKIRIAAHPRQLVERGLDRAQGTVGVVQAAEEAQLRFVERLDADREPGDAGLAQRARRRAVQRRRIALDGDLERLGLARERGAHGGQHAADFGAAQSDGVPPPKKTDASVSPATACARQLSSASTASAYARCGTSGLRIVAEAKSQ